MSRFHKVKKCFKKVANKAARKSKSLKNGSHYKKVFDYKWAIY